MALIEEKFYFGEFFEMRFGGAMFGARAQLYARSCEIDNLAF